MSGPGEMLRYTDPDGLVRVQVRLADGSVWLSQAQMAELYGTTSQNITQHVGAIYGEGEQDEGATCKPYLQVRTEGDRRVSRSVTHYSLPMILAEVAFASWQAARRALPERVDEDFEAALREAKAIEKKRPRGRKGKKQR